MRPPVDASRIRELARRLALSTRSRVRIYMTGGATAVLEGWRNSAIDPSAFRHKVAQALQ